MALLILLRKVCFVVGSSRSDMYGLTAGFSTLTESPPGGGTALVFRAIHLTIFWGTDRGHVGNVLMILRTHSYHFPERDLSGSN